MNPVEYTEVEQPLIEQLQSYGYTYIEGSKLENDRMSKASVLLERRLAASIRS